jgi:glycopeptide antibiotics resistance protein
MIISNFPWLLPGIAISALVSIVISRFVAEKLAISRALGYALVFWLGVILSATMTPSISGLHDPDRAARATTDTAWCDLSRIGPPPLDQLDTFNDVGLNVLLFVPLGVLVSAIGRHRWKTFTWAAALPFLIEGAQFFGGAPIGRVCESADVFDNLTGLLLGYVAGTAMNVGREALRRLRNGRHHKR